MNRVISTIVIFLYLSTSGFAATIGSGTDAGPLNGTEKIPISNGTATAVTTTTGRMMNRANQTGVQPATSITEDSTHRFTTDTEKATWNAKQAALGYTPLNPANNLSDVTAATARTNLGLTIGTNVQAYHAALAAISSGTWTGTNTITTIGALSAGSVPYSLLSGTVPTWNQSTTGNAATATVAAGLTGTPNITVGTISAGAVTASNVTIPQGTSAQSLSMCEASANGTNCLSLAAPSSLSTNPVWTFNDTQILLNGVAYGSGSGSGTVSSGTQYHLPFYTSTGTTIGDSGIVVAADGTSIATVQGTSADAIDLRPGSAAGTNTVGLLGPATNPSTSWRLQLPATEPTAGQILVLGTPSSHVVPVTFATPSGGGNVSNSGTPTQYQWPQFESATAISGHTVTASKVVCSGTNSSPVACTNLTDAVIPSMSAPGAIGGTTPSTGVFTAITTTSANTETSITSTATGTGNINLDGVSASDYNYSNGASAATYTPVFTSLPASGFVRYITVTFGGGAGVDTITWTNVNWIGTAGASATTANKKSTYACVVRSSGAWCKIIQEAY